MFTGPRRGAEEWRGEDCMREMTNLAGVGRGGGAVEAAAQHYRVVWVASTDPDAEELSPTGGRTLLTDAVLPSGAESRSVFVPQLVAAALRDVAPRSLIDVVVEGPQGFDEYLFVALSVEEEAVALADRLIERVSAAMAAEGAGFGYLHVQIESSLCRAPVETPLDCAPARKLREFARARVEHLRETEDGVIDAEAEGAPPS